MLQTISKTYRPFIFVLLNKWEKKTEKRRDPFAHKIKLDVIFTVWDHATEKKKKILLHRTKDVIFVMPF